MMSHESVIHSFIKYTIAPICRCENLPIYLSADIVCSEKRTVFQERSLYEEQITSTDKYPNIFS